MTLSFFCIDFSFLAKNNSIAKEEVTMVIKAVIENIRNFMDIYVFLMILGIGIFVLAVDYPFFKKMKYEKDRKVTLVVGIACVVSSFALAIISQLG